MLGSLSEVPIFVLPMNNLIATAYIQTSFGLKGEVRVKSISGEVSHFSKITKVVAQGKGKQRELQVERVRIVGHKVYMKFLGIESREEAKSLASMALFVDRSEANPLEEGEFYFQDLIGLKVLGLDGSVVGTITAIFDTMAQDTIEVQTPKGARLIPYLDQFIGEVSLEKGTVQLKNQELLK